MDNMSSREKYEHSTLEYINRLDEIIGRLETYLKDYFYSNINQRYLSGKIEMPRIYSSESDYQRVKDDIKKLVVEIKSIDKKLNNMQCFTNTVINSIGDIELTEENREILINQGLQNIRDHLLKERQNLVNRIATINDDPKSYLRYKDFLSGNFSIIEDKKVRKTLEEKMTELLGYKKQREKLLRSLKVELSNENESKKKHLFGRKSKKSIDNK
ncbi:MAG: hypothetical protein J6K36_05665 [Bacilli bacterium]|nr:hypothetical protein [Bacilli bacterium]